MAVRQARVLSVHPSTKHAKYSTDGNLAQLWPQQSQMVSTDSQRTATLAEYALRGSVNTDSQNAATLANPISGKAHALVCQQERNMQERNMQEMWDDLAAMEEMLNGCTGPPSKSVGGGCTPQVFGKPQLPLKVRNDEAGSPHRAQRSTRGCMSPSPCASLATISTRDSLSDSFLAQRWSIEGSCTPRSPTGLTPTASSSSSHLPFAALAPVVSPPTRSSASSTVDPLMKSKGRAFQYNSPPSPAVRIRRDGAGISGAGAAAPSAGTRYRHVPSPRPSYVPSPLPSFVPGLTHKGSDEVSVGALRANPSWTSVNALPSETSGTLTPGHGSSTPRQGLSFSVNAPPPASPGPLSPRHGSSTQMLSPRRGSSSPMLSPRRGSSSPMLTPRHGSSTPMLTPRHGSSTPMQGLGLSLSSQCLRYDGASSPATPSSPLVCATARPPPVISSVPCSRRKHYNGPVNGRGSGAGYARSGTGKIDRAIRGLQDAMAKIDPASSPCKGSTYAGAHLFPALSGSSPSSPTSVNSQTVVQSQASTSQLTGFATNRATKDAIQLVSLGCACGPKIAFQDMGLGAETLPFDWVTTTAEGVLEFLRTGFQGFFDFDRKVEKNVQGTQVTAFRSRRHAFWHDDPTKQSTREKYQRRIARMMAIDASKQPVLFVRLAATTDELRTVDMFMKQLISKFGQRALLLLIIDCQGSGAPGACTVEGQDNLLIHYLSGASGTSKFCEPIRNALGWAAKQPCQSKHIRDLSAAWGLATPANPGFYGMGGIPAFEGIPEIY